MKSRKLGLIIVFVLLVFASLQSQDITLVWNTFLGGAQFDSGNGIVADGSGNIYVSGNCNTTWGSPVRVYSGYYDAFVVKLDSNGNLVWNTFLGGALYDNATGIALDGSGNIVVTGSSHTNWGSPINAFYHYADAFVACLDSDGNLLWNTFMGADGYDGGEDIALDGMGNIYVTGTSWYTWGTPVNPFNDSQDLFVACLDSGGNLLWNTFMGSYEWDQRPGIALDGSGNICVTGESNASWGSPLHAYSGSSDVFVARLDNDGNLIWNTFLGDALDDLSRGIALDVSGNIVVAGFSNATWGSPVHAYSGASDVFVAGLDIGGNLLWNSFLGSVSEDGGGAIALNSSGNIYVTGYSDATWGWPDRAYSGNYDAFVAELDDHGNLLGNTFLGGTLNDFSRGIALDSSRNIFVTGYSDATWGLPVNTHCGSSDVFVARLTQLYRIEASVSGGHGSVMPVFQEVSDGENALIHINPDPGYRIGNVIDNGVSKTIANPYVIENVGEDHRVVVVFSPNLPVIEISAQRKTEQAWIIKKDYAEISINISEYPVDPLPVSRYVLYRMENGGWLPINEYGSAGVFTYIDKFLESGRSYSYQVKALDAGGGVIAESNVATI